MTGKSLAVLTIVFLACTVSYAQDAEQETAPSSVPVLQEVPQKAVQTASEEIKSSLKDSGSDAEKTGKEISGSVSAPSVKPAAQEILPQLLSVKDGSFRYSRIPGMESPKTAPAEPAVPAESESEIQTVQDDEIVGLFGITVKMANIAIKIFIVVLILAGLFLFYRIHAGRKKRNVFFKHRRK